MPKFIINGQKELHGEIKVNGAKNAALKIIPAAILSSGTIKIKNLPIIEDIKKSLDLITDLGAEVSYSGHEASINTEKINKTELYSKLADKFRTSVMFVGPLLARFGQASFPHPGGCVIGAGSRPIDLFIEGFQAFGATVEVEDGKFYHIKAKQLQAADFFFSTISVTGTESLMMTASLIPGKTTLRNCAMEPEIEALAEYLNSQGAKIKGAGSPTITIEGVEKINSGEFSIIPDRIETGSFAIMAAASNSELLISDCQPEHVLSLLNIFDKIGVPYEKGTDYLLIKKRDSILKPYSIKTHEYPGFPTDLQSPYAVLMTQAEGLSMINENIYDRRLLWSDMLSQMGANIIMCDPHRIAVNGPSKLYGKTLISPDIRAGIALVIAAMIAKGETRIDNIYQIDRGYEKLEERLSLIGADIRREE
jgi:UDP-N-acetylglucosamine 1-carboxyvinyltransferase